MAAAAAVGAVAWAVQEEEEHEVRAAMDLGSGSMKLVVARCHKKTNTIKKVLQSEYVELLLAHDLKQSTDGCLSEAMLVQAMAVVRHLLRICQAQEVPARNIRAIATQVCENERREGQRERRRESPRGGRHCREYAERHSVMPCGHVLSLSQSLAYPLFFSFFLSCTPTHTYVYDMA